MFIRGELVLVIDRTAIDVGQVGEYREYVPRIGLHQVGFDDNSISLYPESAFRRLSPVEIFTFSARGKHAASP